MSSSIYTWIKDNLNLNTMSTKNRNLVTLLIGVVSFFSIKAIIKMVRKKMILAELESKKNQARSERDMKMQKFVIDHNKEVSLEIQSKIVNANLHELVQMIRGRKVTCVQVLLTYALRAGIVGKDLGYLADVDFDHAYSTALEADKEIEEGRELGKLHGVPFSVYEQISVKGMLTTCGYMSYSDNLNSKDSLIVKILRKEGAIPFAKSNVPQGLMALETTNSLWGVAKNPWNEEKTTGGANGGEAGLVAIKASPIGIGLDLFGAIRIPSAFCGVYGFKPTSGRTSKQGAVLFNGSPVSGFQSFQSSCGPISRSIEDLLYMSRLLIGKFEEDVYINQKPFDETSYNRIIDNNNHPIRIGYFIEPRDCPTAPGIKEMMKDVLQRLRNAGYHMVEFPIDKFEEFIDIGKLLLMNSHMVGYINQELKGEPLAEYYQNLHCLSTSSLWCLKIMGFFKWMFGQVRDYKVISSYKNLKRDEYIEASRKFLELKWNFINLWKEHRIDAIISPVFPTTALDHGTSGKFLPYNHMSYIHNFADLPSVCIPIGLNTNITYTDTYNDELTRIISKNMSSGLNLPIAVQVACLPNEDEFTLRLAKEIDYFYRFDGNFANELLKKYPISLTKLD